VKRVFIGLWPDENTVRAIEPLAESALRHCGGRALHAHHWHITLAFLGALDTCTVQQLCTRSQQWQIPVGPFWVDHYGVFEQSRVLWLGSHQQPSLQIMAHGFQILWAELKALGMQPERRPFTPHISLLRRADNLDVTQLPAFRPFAWQSAGCYLMASRPSAAGTDYRPLAPIRIKSYKGQK